ncbi:protease modulator HflK [Sphingomonas baiyangensis]|uniref:Protease modulator HflK n=1 Tax=Sphingomonas baiyangensis TaxID=2572576 RepID=A0A4V5PTW7_9SPHN|nr:protease modulator HflK [Sphingomonas baiyangensis]TKD51738.1 protease modulator HflK [Sphingomonas baiyangensis]
MVNLSGWIARAGALRNENPKGPWGGGAGGGSGGNGNGGGGSGNGGNGGGPRNPWAFPPEGRRPGKPGTATSLDEFLKRAKRGGGGGGGFGGNGDFQLPGGQRLWWIAAGVLALVWIAFTSIHPIGPQERGVVSLFGRYSTTLMPGIQFTLPAPIASVQVVDVQEIRTDDFPQGATENLMLTGDQNIIDLAYSVRWDIKNAEDFIFELANPRETVRAVAESAMRAAVAGTTLDQAIGAGRTALEGEVANRMQEILDEYGSGVRVQGVAVKQAVAPQAVDEDFKAVSAAQQQAQANINQSRAYAQQVIARSQGEAAQFDKIYEQYRQAPEVTRRRLYYETMEAVLAKSNKTIVEAPGVTPYLPLPEAAGRRATPAQVVPQAEPQTPTGAQ